MGRKKEAAVAEGTVTVRVSSGSGVCGDSKRRTRSQSHCQNVDASCREHDTKVIIGLAAVNQTSFKPSSASSSCSIFSGFPRRARSKRAINTKNLAPKQCMKLDTNVFECYLEMLWKNLPEETKTSFMYLDSLWFSLYRERSQKEKVLVWIKSKQIFSKKNHWSLLILCDFGESLESETRKPCMLLMDSLSKADPKRLEPDIRKFVLDICKEEGKLENKKAITKIPLWVPKVPQQKNNDDCGLFVLYFISSFLNNAPESFKIIKGHLDFMSEKWFSSDSLERFRSKVLLFYRRMMVGAPQ